MLSEMLLSLVPNVTTNRILVIFIMGHHQPPQNQFFLPSRKERRNDQHIIEEMTSMHRSPERLQMEWKSLQQMKI
jgi:hypothetical protein